MTGFQADISPRKRAPDVRSWCAKGVWSVLRSTRPRLAYTCTVQGPVRSRYRGWGVPPCGGGCQEKSRGTMCTKYEHAVLPCFGVRGSACELTEAACKDGEGTAEVGSELDGLRKGETASAGFELTDRRSGHAEGGGDLILTPAGPAAGCLDVLADDEITGDRALHGGRVPPRPGASRSRGYENRNARARAGDAVRQRRPGMR